MEKNVMIRELKARICTVEFTKKNGEVRNMHCTLNESLIPDEDKPKTDSAPRKQNTEVIRVYDTTNSGWRSFRVDSVMIFTS